MAKYLEHLHLPLCLFELEMHAFNLRLQGCFLLGLILKLEESVFKPGYDMGSIICLHAPG